MRRCVSLGNFGHSRNSHTAPSSRRGIRRPRRGSSAGSWEISRLHLRRSARHGECDGWDVGVVMGGVLDLVLIGRCRPLPLTLPRLTPPRRRSAKQTPSAAPHGLPEGEGRGVCLPVAIARSSSNGANCGRLCLLWAAEPGQVRLPPAATALSSPVQRLPEAEGLGDVSAIAREISRGSGLVELSVGHPRDRAHGRHRRPGHNNGSPPPKPITHSDGATGPGHPSEAAGLPRPPSVDRARGCARVRGGVIRAALRLGSRART